MLALTGSSMYWQSIEFFCSELLHSKIHTYFDFLLSSIYCHQIHIFSLNHIEIAAKWWHKCTLPTHTLSPAHTSRLRVDFDCACTCHFNMSEFLRWNSHEFSGMLKQHMAACDTFHELFYWCNFLVCHIFFSFSLSFYVYSQKRMAVSNINIPPFRM